MPRKPRMKSETGIYHVVWRGNNRQTVFWDDRDCLRFLEMLQEYREPCGYAVYAYCLMGNHVHLLMKEGREPLEEVFRRLGAKHVGWHNRRHERTGHLFQDRFLSEAVEDTAYLLTALRYIHLNPVKAGMVGSVEEHPWSSYGEYMSGPRICETGPVLQLFGEERQRALASFRRFHEGGRGDRCPVEQGRRQQDDREVIGRIRELSRADDIERIGEWPKGPRDRLLRELKEEGMSTVQIARILGIGLSIVRRS
ncbi:transposase [Anaerotalea alkaliphila]|uniref:Transposase n=1 Tax=Anaerotalea alkaliphila TaxID=2662126 RepID=A0A7X5KMP5_9FIRM|nr:transposase [Anaerotalea alkaliphila]NDL67184.1 transposase [Anaerotalea alkaliphila]